MRPDTMNPPRRAFTLVELLVVIGIIGVLVALLLPSLAKSRRAAKQQMCASNLHQIAVAAYMYSSDSHSYIVPSGLVYDSPTSKRTWAYEQITTLGVSTFAFKNGFLGRYLQTPKVLLCPEMVDVPIFVNGNSNCDTNSTYALAQLSSWPPYALTTTPVQSPIRVNRIRQTQNTVCAADAILLTADAQIGPGTFLEYPNGQAIAPPSSLLSGYIPLFHGRHANGMGNVAFWDGHVQAVRAAVPPASVATAISSGTYPIVSSLKIGFLARSPVDWSSSGTMFSSTWTQFCYGGFDYYFWIGQK